MNPKYKKFFEVVVVVSIMAGVMTPLVNYMSKEVEESKICNPMGQVTEIYNVSSDSYPVNVEMVGKNGEIINIRTKNATGDIKKIEAISYDVPIKAKVNENIKEIKLRNLKVGDNLEQCKYQVKVIKPK